MRFLDSAFWKIQKRGDYLLLVLAIVLGCGLAYHRRWLCDDAFISFRYAQNLLRYGELVFNPGERVEGYTNFLWTLLLAGGQRLGLPPEQSAILLGLISYAFLMFFFWALAPSLLGGARPLSLLALALHGHMTIFATSGLETMFFTLLAVTGTLWISDPKRAPLPAFALLGTSILVRPDGVVFFAAASLSYALRLWEEAGRPRKLSPALLVCWARAQIGIVALIAAYWFWRWNYFDAFFPNTFYAKSAHSPYAAQGLVYIGLYLLSYWSIPVAAAFFMSLRLVKATRPKMEETPAELSLSMRPIWVAILLWLGYLLWIGGDFMFGRHLTPVLPLTVLLFEKEFRRLARILWPTRSASFAAAFVIAFALTLAFRFDLYGRPTRAFRLATSTGIVEESLIYPRVNMEAAIAGILPLRPYIQSARVTMAFWGAGAFVVYYLDPIRAIESSTGLTEARLARQTISERGRIGHEKTADIEYLRSRGVHISLSAPPPERDYDFNRIELPGIPGVSEIVIYDPDVMARLRLAPGVKFQDFPAYFDSYLRSLPAVDRRESDVAKFREYYFDHAEDAERSAMVDRLLRQDR